ncbi:hypothetical protein GCM10020218_015260 [Dactylosporangium vinaceum]
MIPASIAPKREHCIATSAAPAAESQAKALRNPPVTQRREHPIGQEGRAPA